MYLTFYSGAIHANGNTNATIAQRNTTIDTSPALRDATSLKFTMEVLGTNGVVLLLCCFALASRTIFYSVRINDE